jgi:hypothetical protein
MFVSFEPETDFPQRHGDKTDRARTQPSVPVPSVTYLSLHFHGGVDHPITKALVAGISTRFRRNPPD